MRIGRSANTNRVRTTVCAITLKVSRAPIAVETLFSITPVLGSRTKRLKLT